MEITVQTNAVAFVHHAHTPTHNRGNTLDPITTRVLDITITLVTDLTISDHFCIFISISQLAPNPTVKKVI